MMEKDSCFHLFMPQPLGGEGPVKFTFPFFYTPHPWSMRAAKLLMQELESEWGDYDFGMKADSDPSACGKMFGVLIVENDRGKIGYLKAFSGKLGNSNQHAGYVPPVFDMLDPNGHYRRSEAELSAMNRKIEALESHADFIELKLNLETIKKQGEKARSESKQIYKNGKRERELIRRTIAHLAESDIAEKIELLNQQSRQQQLAYKQTTKFWNAAIEKIEEQIREWMQPIEELKIARREGSATLQAWLFKQYRFLNGKQEAKGLDVIFRDIDPPSGAGECAAPKLLNFAFSKGYKPLCMAEFWWGKSPATEIRTHRNYYPACRGKCLPILNFMLEGVETDPNPLLDEKFNALHIEILFEDESILVLHKPSGLLSVPGKTGQDSVYAQVKRLRPAAKGPLIVHRLDRSTSGIMLIPKTEYAYFNLQQQFINRKIEKRYVAILDGRIGEDSGEISLPIRPDLDDRPRQLVCFEHGREAITRWEKVAENEQEIRVHFYPQTGRTHQLRVHAAHPKGLNAAISGDELYGKAGERLKLHAAAITCIHPRSGEIITFTNEPEF